MTSVTIVGLKPNQKTEIEKEYGSRLDLTFICADTPGQQMAATAASSDHVVLMTKWISHGATRGLRHHDGLTYCNGGPSSLKLKLDQFL